MRCFVEVWEIDRVRNEDVHTRAILEKIGDEYSGSESIEMIWTHEENGWVSYG